MVHSAKYASSISLYLLVLLGFINEFLMLGSAKWYNGFRIGSWTEWKMLYNLRKDKDGFLHKEDVRAVYDGSLFVQMEKERASTRKK